LCADLALIQSHGLVCRATGEVLGVDFDKTMIHEAEQRAEQAGLRAWVEHKLAGL